MSTDGSLSGATQAFGNDSAAKAFLVIGGNGFIGRAVVHSLLSHRLGDVLMGSRSVPPANKLESRALRWVSCDVMNLASIEAACAGVYCVINCYRDDIDEAASAQAINNILDACENNGVQRLIYLSSAAIYGGALGTVHEWTPFSAPINWYGRAKAQAERACSVRASEKMRIAILRPTLVYGPDGEEWFLEFRRSIEAGHLGGLGGHGDGVANLIFVDDLADMCATLAQSDIPEFSILNANGFDRVTFNEYFNEIRTALSLRPGRRPRLDRLRNALASKSRRSARAALKLSRMAINPLFGRYEPVQRLLANLSYALRHRPEDGAYTDYSGTTHYATEAAKRQGLQANTTVREGVGRCLAPRHAADN